VNRRYPDPYPDLLRKDQIQTYILKRTGTLVSKQRIGGWIARGELWIMQRSVRYGGGRFTRKLWVDNLIKKYSA